MSTDQTKLILLGIILVGIAIGVNHWREPRLPPSPQTTHASSASTQQQSEGFRPRFGNFIARAGEVREFYVPQGHSFRFGFDDPVAYDFLVNGELHHHVEPGETKIVDIKSAYKAGLRLTPGGSKREVLFGYVVYVGSEPPKDWWQCALASKPDQ